MGIIVKSRIMSQDLKDLGAKNVFSSTCLLVPLSTESTEKKDVIL